MTAVLFLLVPCALFGFDKQGQDAGAPAVTQYFEDIRSNEPVEISWSIDVFDEAGELAYVHHHLAVASADELFIERVVQDHHAPTATTTSQVWHVTKTATEKLFPHFDGKSRLLAMSPLPTDMLGANFPLIASFYPRALLTIPGTRDEPFGWLTHGGLVSSSVNAAGITKAVVSTDDPATRRTVLTFVSDDSGIMLRGIRLMVAPPPVDKSFEERLYLEDVYEATRWIPWRGRRIPSEMTVTTTFHATSDQETDRVVSGLWKLTKIGIPTADTHKRLADMFAVRPGDHIEDTRLDLMYQIGGRTVSRSGVSYRLPAGEVISERLDEAFLERLGEFEQYGLPATSADAKQISTALTSDRTPAWLWVTIGGVAAAIAAGLVWIILLRKGRAA